MTDGLIVRVALSLALACAGASLAAVPALEAAGNRAVRGVIIPL
jgi:hypothetical protein